MSSNSVVEGTISPTEQQATAQVATTMDAKLIVATGSGDVQQLKDLVKKDESQMMVVVMAKQYAASMEKPQSQQGNIDPHLLALSSSGSSEKLQTLLNGQASLGSSHGSGTEGGLTTQLACSYGDTEANESILEGVTAEGDTALHVVTACGYCNSDNFLKSACIIYEKAKHLLFVQNNKGDTPLHCAARAGKSKMVACLIDLALAEGKGSSRVMKELLRKENKHKETALHEAVRVGNKDIVDLLMGKDSELANFPQDGGASPMYLAIELRQDEIVKTLIDKSSEGTLSFSGPNGQNALHAAVLRCGARDLTELLKWNETHLCPQNKDLTKQRDENGSTPLHFAAAIKSLFRPSRICQQVLEANPDALYQPDHAGCFPIHVAASVGAFRNVDMFVKKFPGSAGLRDAKGRTFLHVAIKEKEVCVIRSACSNLSLSWIMNIVDNDGNTALHLAVEARSIHMFSPLLGNKQVNLNLPNNRGETPLDIAEYNITDDGLFYNQSIEAQICSTLRNVGAVNGVRHKIVRIKANDESKEMEVLKDSTGTLIIGTVLIATVTFAANFTVPGGYIADDHKNGGSPILAQRYTFHAFMLSNTMAFVYSLLATIYLMQSGNPLFNLWSRKTNLGMASNLVSHSITYLAASFALAAYVVLDPVAQTTAIATCGITFACILIYNRVELLETRGLLLIPLFSRKGLIRGVVSACAIISAMLLHYSPLIFIFGGAALAKQHQQQQQQLALAPAPAPLAST